MPHQGEGGGGGETAFGVEKTARAELAIDPGGADLHRPDRGQGSEAEGEHGLDSAHRRTTREGQREERKGETKQQAADAQRRAEEKQREADELERRG